MHKIETMNIKKLLITMSLPIIISMLVQALYNIVDSIFVAQYSDSALLAVSLCYPVQTMMIAVACGMGVGFNTVLARYIGQKRIDRANLTLIHGVLIAILNWLIFAVLGYFFAEIFLGWFTDDLNIIKDGSIYIRICTMASVGVFVQITYERIMQATGKTMYNMIIQAAGAIINIILDPIFIFGYFGLPEMGVAGAALATIIGQITAMLIGIFIVKYRIKEVRFDFKNFKLDKEIIKNIYKVGIPALLMQSIMSFMTVFMNMILKTFSEESISVFNVYYKLQQFVFMAVMGMTNALVPIVAYNHGAKKIDRIIGSVSFALILSTIIMGLGTIIFQIFPKQLLALFNANESMYEIGIPALRIISISFILAGITIVLCSAFQALTYANTSLVITLLRQLVLLLPLTYLLAKAGGLDLGWVAFIITEGICAVISLVCWFKIKQGLTKEVF